MYIVIDIGGTKTRIGKCDELDQSVEIIEKFPTPDTAEKGMEQIIGHINALGADIQGVCIGIAGVVDRKEKVLLTSPNLPGWTEQPLDGFFAGTVAARDVLVANDTDLGGLGEAVGGAGEAEGITAYLTVGTGVGGTRIVNGRMDPARFGFEPGHQIIDLSDFLHIEGDQPPEGFVPGHLEHYVSGHIIEKNTGKDPVDVMDEALWSEFQDRLVAALNNVIVMWSPDVVVLGGSMIIRNEFLSFAYMQKALEKKLKIFPDVPTLQRAVLQDDAGLVGAREYLRQHKSE